MIKLAITGCMGRMGQRIIELAQKDQEFQIVALIESPNRKDIPETTMGLPIYRDIQAIKGADVLIDFTIPDATVFLVEACQEYKVRMVIGTTGLSVEENTYIAKVSHDIAIVKSSNMSIGVNVVFGLLKKMGETLKGYNVSITETHHVHKKDAPSGTAKSMAEIVEAASGVRVKDVASVREGEVVGYHKVTFDGPVDTIELVHNAKTRDMFAEGALVAAKFVAKKNSGFYNMQQVLGLA